MDWIEDRVMARGWSKMLTVKRLKAGEKLVRAGESYGYPTPIGRGVPRTGPGVGILFETGKGLYGSFWPAAGLSFDPEPFGS